jgi:predicted nucleic acid-binding protein
MITAVDTNILLDVLATNERFYEASANALQDAANEGSLVISDIVYAELCIHFETQGDWDAFLRSNETRVQTLTREAHFLASRAWRTYRQRGGKRTRILADFFDQSSRSPTGNTSTSARPRLLSRVVSFP